MRILLTNDDGIESTGIRSLAKKLSAAHEVTIIAPESNRSGVSHSITWLTPVKIRERSTVENVSSFCTSGTPADCVVAASVIKGLGNFDLVVSGINYGQNLGVDVRYSGTLSAALEARIHGIPAMAVSIASEENPDFLAAVDFSENFVREYDWKKLPKHTVLNVNVPAVPRNRIKGINCTRPGGLLKRRWFEKKVNEWGEEEFWMKKEILYDSHEEDLDYVSIDRGFISVSPIDFFGSCEESFRLSLEEDLKIFEARWLNKGNEKFSMASFEK
ncbi:5'-nucleotidase, exopolyphosphatase, 3'-nucleotidase [Mesotoga prima MesG1.Ag.4.2]|uniref:5'-nucleotidase SurE n=1 Tax=Mesotoga prima MesG1.Ag.4.2 TaxID=660470 RepID=I2F3Y0_9BACT|nr:5'/3'-nucleotidase SurE [Mesotoga prima]AFK06633.1 5'-nucleotidase, exopolyphosphatase, 3'-nucleotidase [Mesotoga prima MesG1.Ag.4.2]